MTDEALRDAAAADAAGQRGEILGALHGVPVTVKVNVETAGRPTSYGVTHFKDNIAPEDSSPVRALRAAGAVVIGRTNTPAFALRLQTNNGVHGLTYNPWNRDVTVGGSSGGAAAATASGIAPLSHGTDIAGSTRLPAYSTGIYEIRPTFGRIAQSLPTTPDLPIASQLMNVQGFLARSVRDIRLGVDAMSLRDPRDPWQLPVAPIAGSPLRGRRAAVWLTGYPLPPDPEVTDAMRRAADWLSDAGYEVEDTHPEGDDDLGEMWKLLVLNELRPGLRPLVTSFGDPEIRQWLDDVYEVTRELSFDEYHTMMVRRTQLMRSWNLFFERFPVLITPVEQVKPQPVGSDIGSVAISDRTMIAKTPTMATSVLDFPSLSVPTGPVDGIPTGVQLVSASFDEATMLAAAEIIEACAPKVEAIDPTWS